MSEHERRPASLSARQFVEDYIELGQMTPEEISRYCGQDDRRQRE